jgi:mannose-6-phosphate isomerase
LYINPLYIPAREWDILMGMTNTTQQPITPFLLAPVYHEIVWGGRKMETHLGKALPPGIRCGEAWELHDTAQVASGEHAGQPLSELVARFGTALIGEGNDPAQGMPLLIKFIDANDWLSVQVHPDDADCHRLEGLPRGKNEAWYIVDADPDAALINGVQDGVSASAIADALASGTLRPLLSQVTVQPDDALLMRAGTLHAIGPGLLVYEVQQSCSITYRLYDWDRLGLDGMPRPLHIDKAMQVLNPALRAEVTHPNAGAAVTVFDSPWFITTRHTVTPGTPQMQHTHGRFHAITVLTGALVLETAAGSLRIDQGCTAFVPACIDRYMLSGDGIALCSAQPVHI